MQGALIGSPAVFIEDQATIVIAVDQLRNDNELLYVFLHESCHAAFSFLLGHDRRTFMLRLYANDAIRGLVETQTGYEDEPLSIRIEEALVDYLTD